ncbi:MAG: pyridoxine 5'-phosphate synthase [Calditrichaeota bacterium]|nr:pyridoxine 5'-phosphate synthase [candidate division KSB1 bacterium]MCZ6820143.1 pyridoxine 5'-phosphate synthase [Calditrichota bacterium]TDI85506.1 MAG: pyridoxine 5'-phosphate synthase [Caldithrix sp.]
MMRLGVNVDHIATVREARRGKRPDPVAAAIVAEMAGADGIVCHLREDRRHIKDKDLFLLKEIVKTHLNLEMAATDEMVNLATEVAPDMVTLVPEKREEVTTEGGLDVASNYDWIEEVVRQLRNHNIVVSLFVDPDLEQIKAAARCQADYAEIHTGLYANADDLSAMNDELEKIRSMSMAASKLGLGVSAGHGLDYHNVRDILDIEQIEELNIGHAIVAKAVMVGMESAVREMLAIMRG